MQPSIHSERTIERLEDSWDTKVPSEPLTCGLELKRRAVPGRDSGQEVAPRREVIPRQNEPIAVD